MSANRHNAFSQLEIGVGLRAPHMREILTQQPQVDWFEIISENYMVDGGVALDNLERILDRYNVIQHGVGLYPGSSQGVDMAHLRRVKKLLRRSKAAWVTDHICWGSVDGGYSHDLLPLPYTWEAIERTVENLRIIQDFLEVPFAVENVSSYVGFNESVMSEWDFVNEIVERADVGLLFDVNNVYVSSVNHGFDPMDYVEAVDPARIAQIHIAGHAWEQRFIIDTHDHPVSDPVWQLYARTIERAGITPTLLEWDARLPGFAEVHAEARKAKNYWRQADVAQKNQAQQRVTAAEQTVPVQNGPLQTGKVQHG